MNTRRILVLGASGFVGRHLVNALLASDWATPTAAYHRSPAANCRARSFSLDATDPGALETALGEVDAVVNCVGGSPSTIALSAQALFSAAARQREAPRIVHLSSMAVYGGASREVDESTPLVGDLGAYASAKIAAERAAAAYSNLVILRPSCVYGQGGRQWSERIGRLLLSGRLGYLGDAASGRCNLVHVNDLARAILQALRQPGLEGQVFNLSMPGPPTWNRYFLLYAQALRIGPVNHVSRARLAAEALLLAPFLKALELATSAIAPSGRGGIPMISGSMLRLFRQNLVIKVDKAERMLGLTWSSLDDALTEISADFCSDIRGQTGMGRT